MWLLIAVRRFANVLAAAFATYRMMLAIRWTIGAERPGVRSENNGVG